MALYKVKEPWNNFKYIVEDGVANKISTSLQRDIIVQNNHGILTVTGLNDNENVSMFNVAGAELSRVKASSGAATFNTEIANDVVILKIDGKSIKILLK